jgi:hypothetical protein
MLCLVGVKMRMDSKLFVGWFGPRGLASIVFIVMVLEKELPGSHTLSAVVVWTVGLSIIAHGLSAVPLAKIYGNSVSGRAVSCSRQSDSSRVGSRATRALRGRPGTHAPCPPAIVYRLSARPLPSVRGVERTL